MYSERGTVLLLLAIRIEINITLNIAQHFTIGFSRVHLLSNTRLASVATNSMPYNFPRTTNFIQELKMHAKVLIGLHTTTNTDRTNELLAAPTDRRDTKYY